MSGLKKNTTMKTYKSFIIGDNEYYIHKSKIDNTQGLLWEKPFLIKDKGCNNIIYKLNKYYGNKTVYKAIDVYEQYINKQKPKMPHSIIYDYWFNELEETASEFYKTFGVNQVNDRFINKEQCFTFWKKFAAKDSRIKDFMDDNLINSFFELYREERLINLSKNGRINELID